jgi:hypothetical protein
MIIIRFSVDAYPITRNRGYVSTASQNVGRRSPSWKFRPNLDAAVLDTSTLNGADTCTLNWVDNSSCRSIADSTTGLVVRSGIERARVRRARQRFWVGNIVRAVREVVRITVEHVVRADGV